MQGNLESTQALDTGTIKIKSDKASRWTPERMAATRKPTDHDLVSGNAERSADLQPKAGFPDEPQDTIAYHEAPAEYHEPVVHKGIEHPSAVGKLFMTRYLEEGAEDDYCTGTVISSDKESLVITAAHCIDPKDSSKPSEDIVFVPAYHAKDDVGQLPFGDWHVISATAPECWLVDKNESCDQAILRVAKNAESNETLQHAVGSMGLTVGGSPERGIKTPEAPYMPPLTMHGYPEEDSRSEEDPPDNSRVHLCEGSTVAADQKAAFSGAVEMVCDETITGGASGSAFIEQTQSGPSVIATFKSKYDVDDDRLLAKLNDHITTRLYSDSQVDIS